MVFAYSKMIIWQTIGYKFVAQRDSAPDAIRDVKRFTMYQASQSSVDILIAILDKFTQENTALRLDKERLQEELNDARQGTILLNKETKILEARVAESYKIQHKLDNLMQDQTCLIRGLKNFALEGDRNRSWSDCSDRELAKFLVKIMGDCKINAIGIFRIVTGLELKESKDMIEAAIAAQA